MLLFGKYDHESAKYFTTYNTNRKWIREKFPKVFWPWDTGSAKHSEAAQTVWGNAERAYQLFLTGCGHKKIFKELNIAGTNPSSFISVVKKFREGWIPMEDEEWVDRFQGWTLEINPFKDIS